MFQARRLWRRGRARRGLGARPHSQNTATGRCSIPTEDLLRMERGGMTEDVSELTRRVAELERRANQSDARANVANGATERAFQAFLGGLVELQALLSAGDV